MILSLWNMWPFLFSLDSSTGVIVLVGYGVVFASLIILYFVFRYLLPFVLRLKLYRRAAREGRAIDESERGEMSGEVNAAIATAIFLYFNEQHDYESNVITIRKVSRTYSPWSSKIYNMRNLHNQR
ncbi:MAG: OadG family protein [Bacteroidales bacterium]|nr:OadG family protein [Bacteroidales bacterium]